MSNLAITIVVLYLLVVIVTSAWAGAEVGCFGGILAVIFWYFVTYGLMKAIGL